MKIVPYNNLYKFRLIYQFLFSGLIFASLIIQFGYGIFAAGGITVSYVVLYLSYFTILSNIFVAYVFGIEAIKTIRGKTPSEKFEQSRAAAVFCIFTTGIIYTLFLKGPGGGDTLQNSIPWINSVFHYIVPTVMTLDWIIFPTKKYIPWYSILAWIGITFIYLIYVEALGFVFNTYPYFFVNPEMLHGYTGVLRASLGFVPFFIVFGVIILLCNWIRLRFTHK